MAPTEVRGFMPGLETLLIRDSLPPRINLGRHRPAADADADTDTAAAADSVALH